MALDSDVLRDIPSYRKILKVVLKSQIQMLVQQLFEHTGEESVLLSANVANQSLSHLGSDSGKAFLNDCSDVKSKFLSFCVKRSAETVVTSINPSEVTSVPFTKKPYSRLYRRFSRMRPGGKQSLNAAFRTNLKERHQSFLSQMGPKSSPTVDLVFNPGGQGQTKVTAAEKSTEMQETSDVAEVSVVKVEPADSISENVEVDKSSANVSMETEKSSEGGENFQYVLNADFAELPWQQDEHSTSVANQSKRKQAQPIRISKTTSLEASAKNASMSHKECQSDLDYSYENADSSPGKRLLGKQVRRRSFGDKVTLENEWKAETPSGHAATIVPSAIQGDMDINSQESPGVGYSWTEEKPPVGKAYMKTPQIDGIFVSRGLGRYEKLIRCDVCGKVCRTSNMARHKKRYCAVLSQNSRGKRKPVSTRHKRKESHPSDIYIDNPTEFSDESLREMNGSGLSLSMEMEGQGSNGCGSENENYDDMSEDVTPDNVIIKQEPQCYEED